MITTVRGRACLTSILAFLLVVQNCTASIAQDPPVQLAESITASDVDPVQATGAVDELTKQILLKEIELQRFNLHYTLEVAKQGRWKGWRYAFFQEANTGLNLAGGIISTVNRGSNLHHAQGVRLYPQEAANYIPMIGSIIGAGAAATEFGINGFHDIVARRRGFSPTASVKRVKTLKDDITRLMAMREWLIKVEQSDPSLSSRVNIDQVEGKVLADTLDQSLQEFARYHIGARKLLGFQQMQYLFDAAKFTTSAIGSDFAYRSLAEHKRIWNGRAGVLFLVSGQLTMAGPILSRLFAAGVGKYTRYRMRSIKRQADEANIATLQSDLNTLDQLIKQGRPANPQIANATEREAIFDAHQQAFMGEILAQEKRAAKAKLTATENIGAGIFVGGAKTACAVLFLVPGFNKKYNNNSKRAGKVTNELLFTSAVVGLPANAFSMLDTLRIQVQGEIARQKAKKTGQLPAQIANARLKQLEDMEQRLRAL